MERAYFTGTTKTGQCDHIILAQEVVQGQPMIAVCGTTVFPLFVEGVARKADTVSCNRCSGANRGFGR